MRRQLEAPWKSPP
jgi:hypothetical protein